MLFNSFEFLFFFPLVAAFFWLLAPRWRWMLLLAASYLFYAAWRVEYLGLLLFSTLVDYLVGRGLGRWEDRPRRALLLMASLAVNLGLLFSFKYLGFFNELMRPLFAGLGIEYPFVDLGLLLPIGISFYTFQTISYTVDVFRRDREPERHLGKFALYVAFFPQLVAGPIERSIRLLPQFHQVQRLDWAKVESGLTLMAWGFFKKLVIADRAGIIVDRVFADLPRAASWQLVLTGYVFFYQLYCDFSGYSDIAVGSARVMGFELMQNFNRPFAARSPEDFWARWHISLSTWTRDYIFVPLARRVRTPLGYEAAKFLTIFAIGVWHGADMTFVTFGLYFGALGLAHDLIKRRWPARPQARATWARRAARLAQPFLVFQLTCAGAIFIRTQNMTQVRDFFGGLLALRPEAVPGLGRFSRYELAVLAAAIVFMELVQLVQTRQAAPAGYFGRPAWVRALGLSLLAYGVVILGEFHHQPFIYFQF